MPQSIQTITPSTKLAEIFPLGTYLWRPVQHFRDGSMVIPEFKFEKTERGTFLCRFDFGGNFLDEPEVRPASITTKEGKTFTCKGLVMFLEKEPQPNWNALVITGFTKAVRGYNVQDPERPTGLCFWGVAKAFTADWYHNFRSGVRRHYMSNMNMTIEQSVELHNSWKAKETVRSICRRDQFCVIDNVTKVVESGSVQAA